MHTALILQTPTPAARGPQLNESQSQTRALKTTQEQQARELALWTERCRALASRASELQVQLDERTRDLTRIEQRFGHAPSATNEISKLKRGMQTLQVRAFLLCVNFWYSFRICVACGRS
jgi:hypothetical protein